MIYVDSCVLIYAMESLEPIGVRARDLIHDTTEKLAISSMVVHETLVGPLRRGDSWMRERYEAFYDEFVIIDLTMPEYVRAAELRAINIGLRTPDALHLAAAQLSGCDALWTNDQRLTGASAGLAVDVFGER